MGELVSPVFKESRMVASIGFVYSGINTSNSIYTFLTEIL